MIKKWLDVIDMNKDIHRVTYMDYDHIAFHYDSEWLPNDIKMMV